MDSGNLTEQGRIRIDFLELFEYNQSMRKEEYYRKFVDGKVSEPMGEWYVLLGDNRWHQFSVGSPTDINKEAVKGTTTNKDGKEVKYQKIAEGYKYVVAQAFRYHDKLGAFFVHDITGGPVVKMNYNEFQEFAVKEGPSRTKMRKEFEQSLQPSLSKRREIATHVANNGIRAQRTQQRLDQKAANQMVIE